MKFSQMPTEQATNALVKVADPIAKIAADEKFQQIVLDVGNAINGAHNRITKYALIVGKIVPYMLGEHKEDFYTIVGAMTEKSVEDVQQQPMLVTIKDFTEFFDDEFVGLFSSSVRQEE